jgi:hypothetical protein
LATVPVVVVVALLDVDKTPRACFSFSHSLMVCLASRWNWN